MRYVIIIIIFALASCHSHDHARESHAHDDHEEIHSVNVTAWTDDIELFVDYPPLVAGQESRLAVHLTALDGYRPVESGSLGFRLLTGDGERVTAISSVQLVQPGIFIVPVTPLDEGDHKMIFTYDTGGAEQEFQVTGIMVHPDEEAARLASEEKTDENGSISFTKEQAWKIEFATMPAVKDEIFDVVYSSGVWKTAPGATKSLVAPVSGIVTFKSGKLTDGGTVEQGHRLMTISSEQLTGENIGVAVEQALSRYELAASEYDRKKELYESRIIPKAEYDEVKSRYEVAKSTYESLTRGYSSGAKTISAPFKGYIKSVHVQNGDFAEEGDKLITLATNQSKILESHVSPAYAVSEEDIRNIWYQPRPDHWSSLNDAGGTLLSVSEQVSPDHPMAAVFAQVNEEVKMPAGGFTEVQIALGQESDGIVIPETALLEDYGNYSVIVQLSGESFERRPVKTGRRNGDHVEITRGLAEGERVVALGAYQVRMASMSGELPAHGHEH